MLLNPEGNSTCYNPYAPKGEANGVPEHFLVDGVMFGSLNIDNPTFDYAFMLPYLLQLITVEQYDAMVSRGIYPPFVRPRYEDPLISTLLGGWQDLEDDVDFLGFEVDQVEAVIDGNMVRMERVRYVEVYCPGCELWQPKNPGTITAEFILDDYYREAMARSAANSKKEKKPHENAKKRKESKRKASPKVIEPLRLVVFV